MRKLDQRGLRERRVNKGFSENSEEKSDLKFERSSAAKVSKSWIKERR